MFGVTCCFAGIGVGVVRMAGLQGRLTGSGRDSQV